VTPSALSQAEIGVGAIATLAWQCQIPPTCSRKREHGTPELRRDKALGNRSAVFYLIPRAIIQTMTHYAWARWGDINAFFGLILDNVAVMIVLVVLATGADPLADRCFSREFVLTQMIPGTALAALMDGQLPRSAGYLGICAACSFVGIIHSPLQPAAIALPDWVFAQMPQDTAIRCQSPYHWTAAYALAAILVLALYLIQRKKSVTCP
jgi:hypothetical protein